MKSFEQRIKALRAEVEALKAVKRKSSTALNTITKTVTCTSTLYRADGSGYYAAGTLFVKKIGQIEIIPTDGQPLIFSFSQPPYASRNNRSSTVLSWLSADGNPAVIVNPGEAASDSSIPNGTSRDIQLTVNITATADFTTRVTQLVNNSRT